LTEYPFRFLAETRYNISGKKQHSGKEFSDWRLPTKRELNLMYGVFISGNAANFTPFYFWSSTEYDNYSAWVQYVGNGFQSNFFKDDTVSVRAVRAF